MKTSRRANLVLISLVLVAVIAAAFFSRKKEKGAEATAPAAEPAAKFEPQRYEYEQREPSRDGIGKMYFGREISQVMGHPAINWLERSTREYEEAPRAVLDMLELAGDAVVADIGAGSGYYSFRIAELIPDGEVVAIDIQPEMLDFLRDRAVQLGVKNVRPHLGSITSINLPAASIDAAILVDAYHEFSHPNEMLQSLHYALRPDGKVFLLEYRGEDKQLAIKPLHKMTEAQSIREMEAVGFGHVNTLHHLPMQHFMIFEKE